MGTPQVLLEIPRINRALFSSPTRWIPNPNGHFK